MMSSWWVGKTKLIILMLKYRGWWIVGSCHPKSHANTTPVTKLYTPGSYVPHTLYSHNFDHWLIAMYFIKFILLIKYSLLCREWFLCPSSDMDLLSERLDCLQYFAPARNSEVTQLIKSNLSKLRNMTVSEEPTSLSQPNVTGQENEAKGWLYHGSYCGHIKTKKTCIAYNGTSII